MSARRRSVLPMLALLMLALLAAGCTRPSALEVSDARLRAPVPGQDMTVGYFTVRNTTAADIVLTGVSAEQIRAIEMHVTRHDGGVARMRRLPEVVIPAGETVRFEPGGRHLMLFGVSELGDATELVLRTADGSSFPMRFDTVALDQS